MDHKAIENAAIEMVDGRLYELEPSKQEYWRQLARKSYAAIMWSLQQQLRGQIESDKSWGGPTLDGTKRKEEALSHLEALYCPNMKNDK